MDWLTQNWVTLVAGIIAVEHAIRLVSKLTPWQWDDNLADWIANLIKVFKPKPPV